MANRSSNLHVPLEIAERGMDVLVAQRTTSF